MSERGDRHDRHSGCPVPGPRTGTPAGDRASRATLEGADCPAHGGCLGGGRDDAAGLHHRRQRWHSARRRRKLVDRSRRRHSGRERRQRRATRGPAGPRTGRPVHPHVLHDHAVRRVRRCLRDAEPAHSGRAREALGPVQLRGRSGGERDQGGPSRDRQALDRGLRPRLPRAHEPDDGADREVDAVQALVRAVRRGRLPGADVLSVPRRLVRRRGSREGDLDHRQAGRPRRPPR